MLSKSKTEALNSNYPPVLPTNSSIVKQSRKQKMAMIKRSLTFEQTGGNSKLCHTSSSLSPPSSMPTTTTLQLQCTNQCEKQIFAFSYLLRTNPPRLPDDIFNDLNLIKLSSMPQSVAAAATAVAAVTSPASRRSTVISRSNVNSSLTGKVKVIICVNQTCNNSSSQGLAMVASTALKTVGGLLPTNHPLSTIHPKVDRNSLSPPSSSSSSTSCVEIDQYHKTITLLDPTPSRRRNGGHSKMYKFDNIITQDTLKPELCSIVLKDAMASVLNGKDSCILTIGHKATGKTHSMLGYDYSSMECGIIPYAISWLYQLLNYQKYYYNTRFSIRISAVEIFGLNEEFRDLLANTAASCDEEYSDQSPSHYLQTSTDQNKPSSCDKKSSVMTTSSGTTSTTPNTKYYDKSQSVSAKMIDRLSHLCELRASSAEKAAYLLDTALSNRSVHTCDQLSGLSHMLFTIHLYQCKLENNHDEMTISGGRTKLHFLDLGCGRYGQHLISSNKHTNSSSSSSSAAVTMAEATGSPPVSSSSSSPSSPGQSAENCTTSKALSLSGIGCVLLALLTGRRQLPFNDSSLTYLLREAVSGNQIQPCILAHISSNVQYYTETLHVIQLAAEINRLRRRKVGISHTGTISCKDNDNSNNNNNNLSMHHNSDRSQDDTGSSSIDTETGYIRARRSFTYSRRPRLGRLSYARSLGSSCSSEVDCTSSGEQTCDTVIYVGDNKTSLKPTHRYSDGSQLSINELGPRGLADGSVDVHSVNYRSHRGSTESVVMMMKDDEQSIMKRQHSGNHNRSVNTGHSNNSSTVKRMIPRTNATAWPRIINLRRSKKLSTSLSPTSLSSSTGGTTNITITEETWIDGPNVSLTPTSTVAPPIHVTPTHKQNAANNEQNLVNLTPSEENIRKNERNCSSASTSTPTPTPTSAPPPPPPPPPPSYHNCVHNLIQDNLTTSFICNTEEVCEQLKEEPIVNSIQTQTSPIPHMINIHNMSNSINEQSRNTTAPPHPHPTTTTTTATTTENNFISSNSSGSSNSSTCSTLESNQHRKVPRALSDISERTEDAETLQESNSSSRQLNLNLSHECLTTTATATSFLTPSQLFSFDEKTFCSNPFLSNDNHQKFMDNNNGNNNVTSCSVNTSTKPTEVLLDIGRQIREASKCNNYMIPTSYMSVVNVPQYLNCLNEDEELISNLKITSTTIPTTNNTISNTNNNNKSPLFNHDELKQYSTINENVGTTRDEITSANSHQINSSLSSMKSTDNNDGGSIKRTVSFNEPTSIATVSQCQKQQIKTQRTASQSRKQTSKIRNAEKSPEVSSSVLNGNNNNNVTSVIASTTATNISSNSSLFRVAQWINSITPLYSTDQSVQCFNVNNNCSACTATNNKCDHSVNNSKHHCLNSANQTIHSYLNNADKNNTTNNNDVHYSVYSTTMAGVTPVATTIVTTTPSTLNDSAIGSLKCTKQNGLSKNSSCMAKICENKQTFPLYSSSPVVPPPSLLSSHNDTNPLVYPFYSMKSDDICQILQSHSTPVFISPQETATSPSNHNNNCNNNNNNSHPPYTYQATSPPVNASDPYTHQLTTDNNVVGERLDGLRNQMALINPQISPAYHPYYQYYYYHYQNQHYDPNQICFNNNNNSTDEMTPKQAFYPPTLCQQDQLTQIKLAHNQNIAQADENYSANKPNAYHNNEEEQGEAMDKPTEKLKAKLSLKFLTLPLFRNFRLRRKEKKRNSGKAKRTTDKEEDNNSSSISVTRNGDVEHEEEGDDDRCLIKPSPILHSLSLPVKLTTFGYQPAEGNNMKPNNLSCTDNCCHCHPHSQHLRDYQQRRQQRQLPSPPPPSTPAPPTLGPHSQTSFSPTQAPAPVPPPLHGYRPHSSISSRLSASHHHHNHQASRQFNSHLWSQHCTENVETPIINCCNKHIPHSYSLQSNGSFLNQKNDINLSLSNSPSTGFNAVSGKLSASVCRSTRRSMHITGSGGGGGGGGGGPSSSGYESMRTGASELSLSHQDSASDCSGQCKEILSRRSSLDGYRQRCNSHHHQHLHSHHLHAQSHSSHQSQSQSHSHPHQYDHRSSYQQNNQQHLVINNQS
ncbi:unnamed protein product [Trichobilharzia szidati]|nr:unnamed protein product [Trichobilharzia szidati]